VRARIAASVVLAAGLVLGTAGCTFMTPVATMNAYDPSDGISANVGDVQLRNVFVVSPHGTDANLVGALINSGTSDLTVQLQYTAHKSGNSGPVTDSVDLPAGAVISFGSPGVPQLVFRSAGAKPGALMTIFVQYGDVSGKKIQVPVLVGDQSYYKGLAPSPAASATPTPVPTGTATPAPAN
jgi:hypothetical protein